MSFFFKSSKNKHHGNLPPGARPIKSSDGPGSNVPTLHTSASRDALNRSPQPQNPATSQYGSTTQLDRPNTRGNDEGGTRNITPNSLDDSVAREHARSLQSNDPQMSHAPPPMRTAPTPAPASASAPAPGPGQGMMASNAPHPVDSSPYPWSRRQLAFDPLHPPPFPRYGAAVNSAASKDGAIYIMGGLINGSTVKGDLWTVEAGTPGLSCHVVQTFAEGPGPRVGHASLLVGNAFIVFGGDTKTNEADVLDDTLYLLNTSTKQWSRAAPAGPRPSGRYGHTLNILGSKIYIFGGQVEGFFFNDLVAFDLNALQQPENKWNVLIQNTIEGGPPHGQIPPARTNHTVTTFNDRLYLFGGTDGVTWFNDVWCYDPRATANPWTQLDCIGYIPTAREGHAAALVGDVIYVFGGRTEEGNDLGDLAAFKITSRRWFTFQNMGPSPSPRSGHSMTAVGKTIHVLAGEPSSAPRDPVELSLVYCLDTAKIRYPADANTQPISDTRGQLQRRPSSERINIVPGRTSSPRLPIEQGSSPRLNQGQPPAQRSPGQIQLDAPGQAQKPIYTPSLQSSPPMAQAYQSTPPQLSTPPQQSQSQTQPIGSGGQPRGLGPQSSPPQAAAVIAAQRSNAVQGNERQTRQPPRPDRSYSPAMQDESQTSQPRAAGPASTDKAVAKSRGSDGAAAAHQISQGTASMVNGQRSESPGRAASRTKKRDITPSERSAQPMESAGAPANQDEPNQPAPDTLIKQLEAERSRIAWYMSELALARKAGYTQQTDSPMTLDDRNTDSLSSSEKPMFEALLKMRAEMVRIQSSIAAQAQSTAERIAQIEQQRDNAVNEAVFAKAKLAGHAGHDPDFGTSDTGTEHERSAGLSRKLAAALAAQTELTRQIEHLTRDKSAEAHARQMAEESSESAQQRVAELDTDRQQKSAELERLRDELHNSQKSAREADTRAVETESAHNILTADHKSLSSRLENAMSTSQTHSSVLQSLREAVVASEDRSDTLQKQLAGEKDARDGLQTQLSQLKAQYEDQRTQLETTSRRLQDAEELAEKHASEASTHRQAVLDGLERVGLQHENNNRSIDNEKLNVLQAQVGSAHAKMREHLEAAESAAEKLRRAEERIAGLEAYQEQASREGVGLRKQIQAALRDVRALTDERNKLLQQVSSHELELNAVSVQHNALKDVLQDRGVNPSEVRKARAADSPNSQNRFNSDTPDAPRVRELEQNLKASSKVQEELRSHLDELRHREDSTRRDYEDKLTALDNDHQAAAKYLRGTEKMLSKMKQELQRVKSESAGYQQEVDTLRAKDRSAESGATAWETERSTIQQRLAAAETALKTAIGPLEAKVTSLEQNLASRDNDLESLRASHEATHSDLVDLRQTHESSRTDVESLRRDNAQLESRAQDAEKKVQLLLDQVENSVDSYRRRVSLPNISEDEGNHQRGTSTVSSNGGSLSNLMGGQHGTGRHERHGSEGDTPSISDMGNSPRMSNGTSGPSLNNERNSVALDTLANELDALRSHWETTNKNYRLSDDKFDFEGAERLGQHERGNRGQQPAGLNIGLGSHEPASASTIGHSAVTPTGLKDWRRALEEDSRDSSPVRQSATVAADSGVVTSGQ